MAPASGEAATTYARLGAWGISDWPIPSYSWHQGTSIYLSYLTLFVDFMMQLCMSNNGGKTTSADCHMVKSRFQGHISTFPTSSCLPTPSLLWHCCILLFRVYSYKLGGVAVLWSWKKYSPVYGLHMAEPHCSDGGGERFWGKKKMKNNNV